MNKKIKEIIIGSVMGAVLVGAIVYYNFIDKNKEESSLYEINDKVENFELKLFNGESDTWKLNDYLGKPIVLNFWATWCGPCVEEIPSFIETYEEYDNKVEILAIHQAGEKESKVSNFISMHWEEPIMHFALDNETDPIYNKFTDKNTWPISVFISQEGIIKNLHYGKIEVNELKEEIDKIIQ